MSRPVLFLALLLAAGLPGGAGHAQAPSPPPARPAAAARSAIPPAARPVPLPMAWPLAAGLPARPAATAAFADIPGWGADNLAEALPPLLASCAAILARGEAAAAMPGRGGTAEGWREPCAEAATLAAALPRPRAAHRGRRAAAAIAARRNAMVRDFLERRFVVRATGPGLLTGYYEPELRGAFSGGDRFATPLLAPPPDLVEIEQPPVATAATMPVAGTATASAAPRPRRVSGRWSEGRLEPLPDRAAIEGGALGGRGLDLVWVDDPVDAFFLHIQGSGRVVLANGVVLRLGYAGQNGHGYVPVGRLLIERGEIPRERMSMQAIRAWLAAAGPERAAALMRENPAYVFFRRVEGLRDWQGPIGAQGVPLTPGRSLAVDPAHIPYGAPVFVVARDPVTGAPLRRLTVAQDTGGAIRGPARGDLFWGWGAAAAERAGLMREPAEMFVLLPRPILVQTAAQPAPRAAAAATRRR